MQTGEIPKNPSDRFCAICNYTALYVKDFVKHISTRKHALQAEKANMRNENPENPRNVVKTIRCELCAYQTGSQKDFDKHIVTKKHKANMEGGERKIACGICNKTYSCKRNFERHTSKCHSKLENLLTVTDTAKETVYTEEVILELVKQNKELQTLLADQNKELHNLIIDQNAKFIEEMKNCKTTVTNSNNNSNNNNHFNIQFFLNNQCKDAVNLVDFLDSLKVQVEDLEKTGQLGFVDGISRIFVNGLKDMDICMRPIHCSDLKRETVYVKDENKWDKDDAVKTKLKHAVQKIAQKNLAQIRPWLDQHPASRDTTSPESDLFVQLSHNALGGCSPTEVERLEEKIMKNVLREVVLEKKP